VGATYRGTHVGGGSICFTVTPGWTGVISFLITDVLGDVCNFTWAHRRYPSPLPIANRSFSEAGGPSGSFPSDRGAQGTTVVTGGSPVCTSGPVSWTAITDGTPPWAVPPSPPPPPTRSPQRRARCVVPKLRGKTVLAARSTLIRARCRLGGVARVYSKAKRGRIVGQTKRPGARLPVGTRIGVRVSRGRRR
jgi:hypothetical protein